MSRLKQALHIDLANLSWIAGHWIGSVGDDEVEELWTQPKHGSFLGMFRWFRDGKIRVIEIITIANFDGITQMKFKHLDADLHTWEAQDETTDFTLVEVGTGRAEFLEHGKEQWLIYERIGDRLTVHFERDDGPPSVQAYFEYNLRLPATS